MTEASATIPEPGRCPVCGAGFRATPICSRCKSDLAPLMRIAARAWAARERSRSALNAGDLPRALQLEAIAGRLQRR
jgi:predicted amidophosphoribosyltransferase